MSDVTDTAGVRIISYFEDEVDKIAECIDQEFEVDWDDSVDKRTMLDPDRFGYLSIHRVVRLLPERAQFIEYRRFPDLKCEVQIRSILQHAWAEIEHDLGYKTKLSVPKHVRRSFSRLAGLLEIADKEFISLRNELTEYEYSVSEQLVEKPQVVPIDKVSLKAFKSSNETLREIDHAIAEAAGANLSPRSDDYFEKDVFELNYLNVITIADLEILLQENKEKIILFAKTWLNQKNTIL